MLTDEDDETPKIGIIQSEKTTHEIAIGHN
jgi:hypothetical protein